MPNGSAARTWTKVFAEEMVAIGARRPDVVAITAAMLYPTGLAAFADAYPDRAYDVGIAEQHAVTSAAGLAMGGMHPVVAIYSTFLNRAFDQLIMDVALHKLPVTFVLDRAGVTGADGPSHNGMWDGSILQVVPGLRIAAPRDATRLAELLREAVATDDGPTVLRWPKATVGDDIVAVGDMGSMDVLGRPEADGQAEDVLLIGAGVMAGVCVQTAARLSDQGIGVTVVDPRWIKPVDEALVEAARGSRLVVVVEDNGRAGGFGDAVCRLLRDHDVDTPARTFGLPQEFLGHGDRTAILAESGLTPQHLARQITEIVAHAAKRTSSLQQHSQASDDDGGPAAHSAASTTSPKPLPGPAPTLSAPRSLRVAVVGSGPAGIYTAEALVKQVAALAAGRESRWTCSTGCPPRTAWCATASHRTTRQSSRSPGTCSGCSSIRRCGSSAACASAPT